MKRKLKLCKGFNEYLCENCKRQSDEEEKPIVKRLMCKVETKNKVCEHYIRK
jgi:hypothetical protein